ncbi:hypothetical protein ACFV3R_25110 [Streptomyces sp. NPDC059740]|uniref:hypothetical protein n=1 Tax=Streptomyces sp. NPDC059740 TaxID=3346926 RepID=UPI00364722F1
MPSSSSRPNRRMSAKAARAVIEAADLVKAPDHRDTSRWEVRSGDLLLGHVEPSYGGASRSGRNGWIGRSAQTLIPTRRCATRQEAAAEVLLAWERQATAPRP